MLTLRRITKSDLRENFSLIVRGVLFAQSDVYGRSRKGFIGLVLKQANGAKETVMMEAIHVLYI